MAISRAVQGGPEPRCALCGEARDLCDSHLMPQFVYKRLRYEGRSPTKVHGTVAISTDQQDHTRLLCWDCETTMRLGGEDWAARQAWSQDGFPLLETVSALPRTDVEPGMWRACAGEVPEIGCGKLAHFGVGVVWRYHAAGRIDLGPYAEPLRAFLLGQSVFPRSYALTLHLLDGAVAHPCFTSPKVVHRSEVQAIYGAHGAHGLWVCTTLIIGLGYNLTYGKHVAEFSHHNCLVCSGTIFGGPRAESNFRQSADSALITATPKGRLKRDLQTLG